MNGQLRAVIERYNTSAPLAEASTIPAQWYTDAAIAEIEKLGVFGQNWIVAGRSDQVARPGQFFTAEVAGEPILVVRDGNGVLRGFFNVCRHHAAAVAWEPSGVAQQFRCPYHGWTYGLDGALKGVTEFDGVANFDRACNGLVPVLAEAWKQFVFVNLNPHAEPLTAFLGSVAERIQSLDIDGLEFVERRTYSLNCNWKVFVDNYLDGGYHVPHMHKGLNSVLDYVHYKVENLERSCVQSSPMRMSAESDPQSARTRRGDRAFYFWLYPDFMINCYAGMMDTNLVLLIDIGRCAVIFDFYFSRAHDQAAVRESIMVSERIQAEDIAVCESVQRGLGSRAYGAGRLSAKREAGEHLFHRLLAKDLRRALDRSR